MKVLDSTFLIDVLRGRPEAKEIIEKETSLLTTQINMYEVITEFFYQNLPRSKFAIILNLFEDIRVLPLDEDAVVKSADVCAALMKEGVMIDDCDCLTAGIALSHGVSTIITRNDQHFRRVKGLKVISY